MLTTFCTGYAMGMATVGVAIILVDNYLNPKANKPKLNIPKINIEAVMRKIDDYVDRKASENPKPAKGTKPKAVKEIKPVVKPVVEEEETFTVDEILAEFQ